ncbi:hypothetical protein [Natronococcus pandeyae]|uniref:hypothetical protein n=1 Tax=Natronococcus pandeyae TaxID=2055836 RepID=UPI0011E85FAB|nr:hypothetical protein [Natronococcus pandeyae]
MKLEGIINNNIYMTNGRTLYISKKRGGVEYLSTLPNPKSRLNRAKYNLKTGGIEAKIRRPFTGYVHSVNVWPINEEVIFANAYRSLFVSHDGGRSWKHSLELPESSGLRGIMPCGLCHKDGIVYIGEYIFDEDSNPRILATDDFGRNWVTYLELEGIRHIHSIQTDCYSNDIWVTTGDRNDESVIGILRDDKVEVIGTGSQKWRAVQPIFLPDAILWGTDVPYEDNHICMMKRSNIKSTNKNVKTLHTTSNPFYYATSINDWAFFSTSVSANRDSTAPDGAYHESNNYVTVWGASSSSEYQNWQVIDRFGLKQTLSRRLNLTSFSANSYIFLDSYDDTIIYNPINTENNNNKLMKFHLAGTSS